jgi:glyoxylase-like metal-dependent hydrolase (beta-lactamase superfamily II)
MKRFSLTLFSARIFFALTLILGSYTCTYAQVQEIPESVAIKITDGIYVHERNGANITISSGKDGLLIIDTGYRNSAAYSDSIIRAEFQKPVKYVLNTHLHFDHVGGNDLFSRGGAVIVAHENTRKRMMKEWRPLEINELPNLRIPIIPPYPDEYLPDLCFYDSIHIHFNDQHIRCVHIPGGHSDGDVVIQFRDENVIQTGDLFLSNAFPPIEGTTKGYLAAVEQIIGMCDENTIVIPGHGHVSDRNGLINYHELISNASKRINSLKAEGKDLTEVLESNPFEDLLEGESKAFQELFIYCVYNDGILF